MRLPWKKKENKKGTIPDVFREEVIIDLAYQMRDDSEGFISRLENVVGKASDWEKADKFFKLVNVMAKKVG